MGGSLNRTSVGLKLQSTSTSVITTFMPQSNQRGIETKMRRWNNEGRSGGLNRTSVGLKLDPKATLPEDLRGLNRTSVGLKQ